MTESSTKPTSFGETVQKARAAMSVEGVPPTLDAPQFVTDIDDFTAEYLWDEADAIEGSLPEHDYTDPAARSVVASMLWNVSQPGFLPTETEEQLLPPRRELFRRYLSFRPAGSSTISRSSDGNSTRRRRRTT